MPLVEICYVDVDASDDSSNVIEMDDAIARSHFVPGRQIADIGFSPDDSDNCGVVAVEPETGTPQVVYLKRGSSTQIEREAKLQDLRRQRRQAGANTVEQEFLRHRTEVWRRKDEERERRGRPPRIRS